MISRHSLAISPDDQACPALPQRRVLAIGDIHGRKDLLDALLADVPDDVPVLPLGDYIDRGDDGIGVLLALEELRKAGRTEAILMGNHEQMMLTGLYHEDEAVANAAFETWLVNGGEMIYRQVFPDDFPPETHRMLVAATVYEKADRWRPALIRAFTALGLDPLFESMSLMHEMPAHDDGGMAGGAGRQVVFVHAGLLLHAPRKAVLAEIDRLALPDRMEDSPLWIRTPFLHCSDMVEDDVALVVHGHTIEAIPGLKDRRLGLDTGAYSKGVLTGCLMGPEGLTFLQACEPGKTSTLPMLQSMLDHRAGRFAFTAP